MQLLIIEDEEDFAKALAHGLQQHGYAVDLAFNGEQGLFFASIYSYDLVILDLNLPDIDGFDICQHLREQNPEVLILILTARARIEDKVTGLDLGADDYLVKPFHFQELFARIRALIRRQSAAEGRKPILQWGDLKLDPITHTAWQGKRKLNLTRKEFAILEYFMRHPGKVISQEELLEHIWNAHVNPFTNTVRVHIRSLRKKLGDNPEKPRYIKTIIGVGYCLLPPQEQNYENS
ncbi:MAG: response regulator transcription factor [Chloroflexi bacterium]|nr:response regulator transcription factor [Chloroflexota bacterium]